jgi:hypothetical protein
VKEYVIDPQRTAFRWWKTPFASPSIQDTSFEQSGDACVTHFAFTSDKIAGQALNTTGWNRLIWAVNKATAYPGYHTEGLRGHITIDFSTGAILPPPTSAPPPTVSPVAPALVVGKAAAVNAQARLAPSVALAVALAQVAAMAAAA